MLIAPLNLWSAGMNNLPAQASPALLHQGSSFAIRICLYQKRAQQITTRCCLNSQVPISTTMAEMPLLPCQSFLSGVDVWGLRWDGFLSSPDWVNSSKHFPVPCQVLIPLHPVYNWIFFLFSSSPLQSNRPFLTRIFFGVSLEHEPLQKGRVNFPLSVWYLLEVFVS